jgi:Ca-activated chloride channel homolog
MSFERPAVLALLVIPVALVAFASFGSRRRTRHALRFAHVDLLDDIAPKQPWRRFVPGLLTAFALAFMAVALAHPYRERVIEEGKRQVILAFDVSNSMSATDVQPSRLDVARRAANDFINSAPDDVEIGLVEFAGTIVLVREPTLDRVTLTDELDRIELQGGTAIGDAIVTSLRMLGPAGDNGDRSSAQSSGLIVVLSDGATTAGVANEEAAAQAAERGVQVSTIAFGTVDGAWTDPTTGDLVPVPVAPGDLAAIAAATGGVAAEAANAAQLQRVFDNLSETVQSERKREQLADWFVAAALAAALASAALSWRWFARLS